MFVHAVHFFFFVWRVVLISISLSIRVRRHTLHLYQHLSPLQSFNPSTSPFWMLKHSSYHLRASRHNIHIGKFLHCNPSIHRHHHFGCSSTRLITCVHLDTTFISANFSIAILQSIDITVLDAQALVLLPACISTQFPYRQLSPLQILQSIDITILDSQALILSPARISKNNID